MVRRKVDEKQDEETKGTEGGSRSPDDGQDDEITRRGTMLTKCDQQHGSEPVLAPDVHHVPSNKRSPIEAK